MSKALLSRRVTLALLLFNFVGAIAYEIMAFPSWAIPQEHGMIPITGEPFVWAAGALPILGGFSLLDLIWCAIILARREWRIGRSWILVVPIWIAAIIFDFLHH